MLLILPVWCEANHEREELRLQKRNPMLTHGFITHLLKFFSRSLKTKLSVLLAVATVVWIFSFACIHREWHEASGAGSFHTGMILRECRHEKKKWLLDP